MLSARIGIALISAATLLFEVTLTRLLSFTLWYHFAFLVIGVALLGTASAASWLAAREGGSAQSRSSNWALGLALALPLGHSLFQLIPFDPFALAQSPWQWLWGVVGIAALAAPFFATGVIIASQLEKAGDRPFSVYGADLLGAALGAATTPLFIRWVGAPGAVLMAAFLAMLGAFFFARAEGDEAAAQKRRTVVFAALAVLALILAPLADRVLPWRVTAGKRIGPYPAAEILSRGDLNVFTEWDISSRVDVIATKAGPRILIDGGTAMTRVPRIPKDLSKIRPIHDVTNVAFKKDASILIIGSGGGWEVLRALSHQVGHIDAVEINPLVVKWVKADQRFGAKGLHDDPRVTLHHDEGRAFLAALPDDFEGYDAILMVHTISNAATGAGAMSLAEDYILTQQAFEEILSRLKPNGLFFLTRPRAQLARLVATTRAALAVAKNNVGTVDTVDIDAHALAFTDPKNGPFFAGLIASPAPLSSGIREELAALFRRFNLQPEIPSQVPFPHERALRAPATDDTPFFSQRVAFSDLSAADFAAVLLGNDDGTVGEVNQARLALEEKPVAEVAALTTGLLTAAVAFLGIFLPFLWRKRRATPLASRPGITTLRFAFLGLAFMFVEIVLIQMLTRVLGHPSLAFAIVLGAVLLGTGLSSQFLAPRLSLSFSPLRLSMGIAAAMALALALIGPPLIDAMVGAPLWLRAVMAALFAGGSGLALGLPFPISLRDLARGDGNIPWAFAVNGFASVIAPALTVVFASQWGLAATLFVGAGLYGMAGILPPLGPPPQGDGDGDPDHAL
jgi:SAM-dependent methyltransferase